MNPEWINPLIGGIIIGIAASVMLIFNGRVTGVSGILYGSLFPAQRDLAWRLCFLLGLFAGGLRLRVIRPEVFNNSLSQSNLLLITAGLLVGFGTVMGNGCTSGHGVCGVSRLSPRSIVATIIFVFTGMLAVVLLRSLGIIA